MLEYSNIMLDAMVWATISLIFFFIVMKFEFIVYLV